MNWRVLMTVPSGPFNCHWPSANELTDSSTYAPGWVTRNRVDDTWPGTVTAPDNSATCPGCSTPASAAASL
ncbi:hypothetical protein GCM10027277_07880 [Pseudoduganella ginsengisoli]